jgi:DnaJ-class molecular chaperone
MRAKQVPLWTKVLGVSEAASVSGIKTAFHRKAKRAHPDMGGSNAAMAALNRAFDDAMIYKKASGL